MAIEIIEFPSRAALAAALGDIRATPGVEHVDILDMGRTMRVHSAEELKAPAKRAVPSTRKAEAKEESEPDGEKEEA